MRTTHLAHAKRPVGKRAQSAFTMVEIAIALGVIGFALVAIIGVLPLGLNVQKDNREETIINQDGPYILEAIRNGAQGFDNLTNHIDSVGVVLMNTNGVIVGTDYDVYSNAPVARTFVGLMSRFRGDSFTTTPEPLFVVRVEAKMRALSGSALEQSGANSAVAFSYLLTSEIVRHDFFADSSTNWSAVDTNSVEYVERYTRWLEAPHLANNLHEARLKVSWPLLPNGNVGPNRQLFRTQVSGVQAPDGQLRFFQPQAY
jgi:hypothetical protein